MCNRYGRVDKSFIIENKETIPFGKAAHMLILLTLVLMLLCMAEQIERTHHMQKGVYDLLLLVTIYHIL